MSNGPTQKWKSKGIELALWENAYGDTYTLTKSYKNKKTDEWVRESIKLFPNELELIGEVVAQGIAYSLGAEPAEKKLENISTEDIEIAPFDDEDIPF